MSLIVRERSRNAEVRQLAYDILNTQLHQAGQMYGWLESWGLPQSAPEPSMTWMTRPPATGSGTHGHEPSTLSHAPGQPMPGYATPDQMSQLEQAQGPEADRIYLELMLSHHRGAVVMAEAVLARSNEQVVVDLAASVMSSQTSELEYLEDLRTRTVTSTS